MCWTNVLAVVNSVCGIGAFDSPLASPMGISLSSDCIDVEEGDVICQGENGVCGV